MEQQRIQPSIFRHLAACFFVTLTACWAQPSSESAAPRFTAERHFGGKALELAKAVDRSDAATIQRLIRQEGVDPNTIFTDQAMPMVAWPILNKNPTGLRLLLEAGADPNARRVDAQRKTGKQRNNAMVLAAGEPDSRYLAMLLDHGGDPNTHNSNGEALTHVAYLRDQWQNVQLLIERGADINEGLYDTGSYNTVVSWYSKFGNFDKVHWLLQKQPDVTRTTPAPPGSVNPTRMPIVDEIYWLPVKLEMVDWQRKCQHWLRDHGIERTPIPIYLKERREKLGLPSEEKDIPLL
ncbi:ankyrin repeat domain-containing protein [Pseudoxanthomonas wuyuanensis]|uniref:Ankyrin repeat n=1 Tax=Pseudoxanthomonas wuyuanensis TaxID=1073196 RepID=A0A286D9I8_9GAMM|nr:ankyrin repeat domain-containing protein [Pseudoxanthomonas wuyuanensis]SOD55300.1 Ankyrin repeat [Pseudoxanthomonas wuyuanensis]